MPKNDLERAQEIEELVHQWECLQAERLKCTIQSEEIESILKNEYKYEI